MKRVTFLLVMLLLALPLPAAAQATTTGGIEQHLKKMQIKYKKAPGGELEFATGFPNAPEEKFLVRALPEVKVVYLAILDVAPLPAEPAAQVRVLRAVNKLNYELLIGKIELEPDTNTFRLSFTFANENGVDFATFQAVMQSLLASVGKVRQALR